MSRLALMSERNLPTDPSQPWFPQDAELESTVESQQPHGSITEEGTVTLTGQPWPTLKLGQ
jgi:hypothetical protein